MSPPQDYKQPPQLQLSDCPLLLGLEAQLPLLVDSSSGSPITLQQLQAQQWWAVLPQHLQQVWRRRANSSSWLFTPHIDDLVGATQQQQQGEEEGGSSSSHALVCALARAVFWARWLLGEPVIVRGIQVGAAAVWRQAFTDVGMLQAFCALLLHELVAEQVLGYWLTPGDMQHCGQHRATLFAC
jgi:hypothetical protein